MAGRSALSSSLLEDLPNDRCRYLGDGTHCLLSRMKKRVCLAGFTETEIRALQPAFRQISASWSCEFLADGPTVISAMENEPFSAVVADLSTNSQNGAGLLRQIANSRPRTLLFALGEVEDRELVANFVGGPYQFLSRPWKPPELIAIIERSLAFDSWLSTDRVRDFVPQLGRLPCLTSTYFEILRKTESPNASIESVAEIVARDPALTARLLQTVNSAATGLSEKITSPADAVATLGLETVKSLVLCLQVFDAPASQEAASISLDELWRRSFGVAQLARQVATLQTLDSRMASDAFTAGLLHRIGQIVLATNLSKEYTPVVQAARERGHSLQDEELARLGVTSNQIGAHLLSLWGMPLPIVEAAAFYPTPSLATTPEFSLLTAVHVADVLSSEDSVVCKGLPGPKLDRAYLAKLDLPIKPEAWRKLLANGPEGLSYTERKQGEVCAASKSQASASAQGGTSKVLKGVLALAAVGIAAVVGITKWHPGSSGQAASAPAEQGGAFLPSEVSRPSGSSFDSIKVQGIFYRANQTAVVINGQTLSVGQKVNGVKVVLIKPSVVVLESEGEQREYRVK